MALFLLHHFVKTLCYSGLKVVQFLFWEKNRCFYIRLKTDLLSGFTDK